MNNDLISRSELKKAIKNLYNETLDGIVKFGIEKAYKEIDNAPTVDLWEMRQEATENALKKAEVLYARPQGEWKLIRVADHCGIHDSFVCPFCNYEREYRKKNFCEECGADLRGDNDDG